MGQDAQRKLVRGVSSKRRDYTMLHEKRHDIVEGPSIPDELATSSYNRLTIFSFVPLFLGSLYFLYRTAGIASAASTASWTQLLIFATYFGVELSFAGEAFGQVSCLLWTLIEV